MVETTIQTLGRVLSWFVSMLSKIDLRQCVLVLGLLFCILSWRPNFIDGVDRIILKLSSYLFETPVGASPVAIIQIPEETIKLWQNDIHNAGQLSALLANILHSSQATIGILFDGPIDTGAGEADKFLEKYAGQKEDQPLVKEAQVLYERKRFLLESLNNDRVVVGIENTLVKGMAPVFNEKNVVEAVPAWVHSWLWPACERCESELSLTPRIPRPIVELFPVIPAYQHLHRAFYSEGADTVYPGFLLQYLNVAFRHNDAEPLPVTWNPQAGISLGERLLSASYFGEYVALHNLSAHLHPHIERVSLEEALARRAFPKYLFIAGENDLQVDTLARAFYSIEEKSIFAAPWWFVFVDKGLIFCFALLLFFLAKKIRSHHLIYTALVIVVLVLGTQVILFASRGYLLPMGASLFYLIIGLSFILIWKKQYTEWSRLKVRSEDACLAQAEMLVESDRMDEAGRLLLNCGNSDRVLQKLYEFADTYSQQKDFQLSVELFTEIRRRKKNFRDVGQKLDVLTKMLEPESRQENGHGLEQTRVLISKAPSDPSKLGRYEVNQEIGRGAVGRVFLGFDPRIARNVAIKTLNYQQFEGDQLNDLKARFFREAEAAGRLSHPNIVSVYDVGEEANLAYIAMDYVEGKPLNQFVDADNLLPIFEVYRIICDVASAMEYAHENNIIHRDIKPGNIMYSPSPYQVKVTDFGIARLVDDSKTSTGEILGSPLYMAPEQLKGKKVTRQADVFSLGVTFYQLLTGELPFKGDNLASLTYEIIHGKHKNIRTVRKDLPASAARIVNQALQKDPGERYESAAEMHNVLKRAIRRDFATEAKNVGFL